MFTGIITDCGHLRALGQTPGGETRIEIATAYDVDTIALGESIACAGICLTVIEKGRNGDKPGGWLAFTASAETLACTNMGAWRPHQAVNLEQALRLGDPLGGHLVAGHVDAVATVTGLERVEDSTRLRLAAPPDVLAFVAPKGCIALDGVSLTVNQVTAGDFTVNVIPHTLAVTTLGELAVGDRMNMEIDLIARYVARRLSA